MDLKVGGRETEKRREVRLKKMRNKILGEAEIRRKRG